MKLIPFGSNQNLVIINDDTEIFYSYKTAVAGKIKGKYYKTNEWYSRTTTRHINNYLGELKTNLIEALATQDFCYLDAADCDYIFQKCIFGSCVYG